MAIVAIFGVVFLAGVTWIFWMIDQSGEGVEEESVYKGRDQDGVH